MKEAEFILKINAYSPETIPLVRLGQYIAELGNTLADLGDVTFKGLVSASTGIAHMVKNEDPLESVNKRMSDIGSGAASQKYTNAFRNINKFLTEDGADAVYSMKESGATIIKFPGKNQSIIKDIGPLDSQAPIDGVVVSIGNKNSLKGKNERISIKVQDDGITYECTTTKEIAKKLARHLFEDKLRFNGVAEMFRNEETGWYIKSFKIESFDVLEYIGIDTAIAQLRSINATWDLEDYSQW